MKRQFSAGVITYYQESDQREYLLLQHGAGYWDFPKGKIEKGESKEQAALRELKEETGLDAILEKGFEHSLDYYFKEKNGNLIFKTVFFLAGRTQAKDVVISHEHVDFIWLPYHEALDRVTYKNAKEVLMAVEKFLNK